MDQKWSSNPLKIDLKIDQQIDAKSYAKMMKNEAFLDLVLVALEYTNAKKDTKFVIFSDKKICEKR